MSDQETAAVRGEGEQPPLERSDGSRSIKEMVERLKVADDTLRVTAALRIALRALAWYADEKHWSEDIGRNSAVVAFPDYGKGGQKARNAIKRIEKQLDHERTSSPLQEAVNDGEE